MSDWYYAANNEQKGPINESELKANFATAKLPPDTLVWQDGMGAWTPANQVAAFSFRQPPAPAKVQPATATTPEMTVASATTKSNPASVTPLSSDLLGTPEALEVSPDDADKNKVFGILAYLGILFVVPLIAAKDSPFAKYHANQGLVLFIAIIALYISLAVVEIILYMIVPGGFGIIGLLFTLVRLAPIGLIVLGILNAAAGKCVPLPVIGGFKLIK